MYRYELRSQDARPIERILSSSGFFSEEEVEIGCSLVTERLEKGEASGYYFILLEERGTRRLQLLWPDPRDEG